MNKSKIKALLIDDEPYAIESLKLLLQLFSDEIEIIGTAATVSESVKLLNQSQPDVVFLDVELKDGSGFDIFNHISSISFELIVTTGYNHYAITAIKFSAIDYLLKPIDKQELNVAIQKLKNKLSKSNDSNVGVKLLLDILKYPKNQSNRIMVASSNAYEIIPVCDIIYCEAQGDYTFIYLNDSKKILSTLNIGEYEDMLTLYDFFRVHQSFLVNKNYIKKFLKQDGGFIELLGGKQLPISRRRKNEFLIWLKTV